MKQTDKNHWLVRPESIKLIWRVFIGILVCTVLLQFVVPVKGYFGPDKWLGFGAGFGFLACLAMVLVAKLLGVFLKRPDDYYAEDTVDD